MHSFLMLRVCQLDLLIKTKIFGFSLLGFYMPSIQLSENKENCKETRSHEIGFFGFLKYSLRNTGKGVEGKQGA